jgi:hypothetical protein
VPPNSAVVANDPFAEEDGVGIVDDCPVLVPPGIYVLGYSDYETASYFGRARVTVRFGIMEPEQFAGLPLERFYNVKRLIGTPRKYGDFQARARSDLVREYRALTQDQGRLDRISFSRLKGRKIQAEVATVQRDHAGNSVPDADQYSRIARLVRCLPDAEW